MPTIASASERFNALVQSLASTPGPQRVSLDYGEGPSTVLAFHPEVAARLKPVYAAARMAEWAEWLDGHGTTRLELTGRGLIRAAERVGEHEQDPINYDAVWVRDAAWGALALLATPGRANDGGRVVRQLLRSLSTPAQLMRFAAVIEDPAIAASAHPDAGMNVVHVRFDGRSPDYEDVKQDGEPASWNHKQNDALGLFLIALDRACTAKVVDPAAFAAEEWAALIRFAPYFEAIAYEKCEDAGAWEEIERVNTSSVGIVSYALDGLAKGLAASTQPLYVLWRQQAAGLPPKQAQANSHLALQAAARRGMAVVHFQLPEGESPEYPPGSPQRRGSDAAMLALIAPATLSGLDSTERWLLLAHVDSLIRPAGVLRYAGDTYQAANAWFVDPWPEAPEARAALQAARSTGPLPGIATTASAKAFVERARGFVPGTEAQWFFDSWISWARAELYLAEGEPSDLEAAFKHYNRALGQITGPNAPFCADGRLGQAASLPESYNTILLPDGARALAPSPVLPLNWSKASLLLAHAALSKAVSHR